MHHALLTLLYWGKNVYRSKRSMLSYSVVTCGYLLVPSPSLAVLHRRNCIDSHNRHCSRIAHSLSRDTARMRAQHQHPTHVASMGAENNKGAKKPKTINEIKVGLFAKLSLGRLPQYSD